MEIRPQMLSAWSLSVRLPEAQTGLVFCPSSDKPNRNFADGIWLMAESES